MLVFNIKSESEKEGNKRTWNSFLKIFILEGKSLNHKKTFKISNETDDDYTASHDTFHKELNKLKELGETIVENYSTLEWGEDELLVNNFLIEEVVDSL